MESFGYLILAWLIVLIIASKLKEKYRIHNPVLKEVRYIRNKSKTHELIIQDLIRDINHLIHWCLNNKYPNEKDAQRLYENWIKVPRITETSHKDHIAYVVDKNKNFFLCITKPNGDIEDSNTMRFVVFHELAHMMSASYGHNQEFSEHFLDILRVAVHLGIYKEVNYLLHPVNYCGTSITRSPCDTYSCKRL